MNSFDFDFGFNSCFNLSLVDAESSTGPAPEMMTACIERLKHKTAGLGLYKCDKIVAYGLFRFLGFSRECRWGRAAVAFEFLA